MTNRSKWILAAFLVGSACLTAHSRVWAVDGPADENSSASGSDQALSEIIVTATRRQERLQDVPISVTALTTEKLTEKQITDVSALAYVVPNMQVQPTLTPLEITLAIRGVTMQLPQISFDPPIATYVDGVYYQLNAGSNNALIDMERVEVLEGPQGTLFGRNTIGGAVSIITNKPTDTFGGYVQADGGDYGAFTGTGVLNLPIKPGLLDVRLVYQYTEHDGYGTNFTTGNPTNSLDQNYFRGTLRFTPTESWEALLSGFVTDSHGYSPATHLTYQSPTVALAPGLPPNNVLIPLASGHPGDLLTNYINNGGYQDAHSNLDSTFALQEYGLTGTITGRLNDAVSVKSITGYTHTEYNTVSDVDGTPYTVISLTYYPVQADQFSQELQAYGDAFDRRLTWIGGVYYFWETGTQHVHDSVLPAIDALFHEAVTDNVTGPSVDNRSYAAFGQVTYEVVPKVRLTGGVRYVIDDREATYNDQFAAPNSYAFIACNMANYQGTDPALCTYYGSVRYSYVPWTAGLDYKPTEDILLYAKVSKGFRAGAFGLEGPTAEATPPANLISLAAFKPVSPESLLSPEIGAKLEMFDHKLRLSAAAFYSRYDNLQLDVNEPPPCLQCESLVVLENSGDAHIWGGELTAVALVGQLRLDGTVGYADAKYVSGVSFGQPVPDISKTNGAVTATYPFTMSAGVLTASSTYAFRSNTQFAPNSVGPAVTAAISQPAYGLLSARISFDLAKAPITLAIYGKNLTNKQYRAVADDYGGLDFAVAWPGPPLTFGGSVQYRF